MKCVYGRAGVRYVITKSSRMDSLPNVLTNGAPLRALRARGSSATISVPVCHFCGIFVQYSPFDVSFLHQLKKELANVQLISG